jgi:hypothetical protein
MDAEIRQYIFNGLKEAKALSKEFKIGLRINLPMDIMQPCRSNEDCEPGNPESAPEEEDLKPGNFCAIPWQWFQTEVEGKIRPHSYCLERIGDFEKESILDLWNGPGMRKYREQIVNGNFEGLCDEPCMFNNDLRKEFRLEI